MDQFPIATKENAEVIRIAREDRTFTVETSAGESYRAEAIIIASGKHSRPLNVKGEKKLVGKEQIEKEFAGLKEEVKLIVFTQELECQYCKETRALAEQVASLSEKIGIEVYNFITNKEQAQEYRVDKIPAIVVMGKKTMG